MIDALVEHRMKKLQQFDSWQESKHPRDGQGRFIKKLHTVQITDEHLKYLPSDLNNTNELKEVLLDILRKKTVMIKHTGKKVIFTRDGIQSSLKMRNPIARKIYLALPDLIENATFDEHEPNEKGHKVGKIKGYDKYEVKANLDGQDYLVKIKIEIPERYENDVFKKDDRYYFHSVEEISLT